MTTSVSRFRSRDSRVIASSTAIPSVSGRWRSRITRSQGSRWKAARPACPFEAADRGTIFLDEIGELAPGTQAKLLKVLEEMTFRRLGGTRDLSVNVRVIAATNKELTDEVERGDL